MPCAKNRWACSINTGLTYSQLHFVMKCAVYAEPMLRIGEMFIKMLGQEQQFTLILQTKSCIA